MSTPSLSTPSPSTAATPWPGLGFDPAPGDPASVQALAAGLGKVADHLVSVHDTLSTIGRNDGEWTGPAAEAFAAKLGELPGYLRRAGDSVRQARDALSAWWTELNGNHAKAADLERQAAGARAELADARASHQRAAADPDLRLVDRARTYPDPDALAAAQHRYDRAVAVLGDAQTRLDTATTSLDALLAAADRLQDEHQRVAEARADLIREAADSKAPPEPDWLDQAWEWVESHSDWLSVAAGISGAIAVFCPAFAVLTVGLSLLALGVHTTQYATTGRLWPPGRHIGDYLTLGGDLLGAVPGIGPAAKGFTAARTARAAAAAEEGTVAGLRSGVTVGVREFAGWAKADDPTNPLVTRLPEALASRLGASPDAVQLTGDVAQAGTGVAFAAPTAWAAYAEDEEGGDPTATDASVYATGGGNVVTGVPMSAERNRVAAIAGAGAAIGSTVGLGKWYASHAHQH
ncbi:putative T7SS-secreted protein [Kitasatospora sp. NPDC052896]|uniref:putative T7SS-secreted protein n=1 Tax=Kitasatospora sp. NPDC052896 TaxID=3364061 RepID=UPI0037CC7A50